MANSIFFFHIDIVNGCQLRCVGCPNSTLLPKIRRMTVEDFDRCLANVDVERVHTLRLFNFGEPLLHRELSTLVARIPEQRFKTSVVEISTNAQKVYWDDFEEVLKLEVVNRLVVSCDGNGTPEEYERLRTPSKWSKFIEFLERARELRDRYSPATQLMTRSVIRSREDRERWESVLLPLGWTPEFRGWMILPESAENPSDRELVRQNGSCFFMADAEEFSDNPWRGEVNLLYVDTDGNVVPCCYHPKAHVFGNLKQQSYNEILNGDVRKAFKARQETDRQSLSICSQCEVGPVGSEGPSFHTVMKL